MYESASNVWISLDLSFFPTMAAFNLNPRELILYAWIIAVNVFAYSIIQFSTNSVLVTVTVNCIACSRLSAVESEKKGERDNNNSWLMADINKFCQICAIP